VIRTTQDLSDLGNIMVLGAHPDDEIFIAGGIMAAAVRNGQEVVCVTATRGGDGLRDDKRWPKEKLPEIRMRELEASLAVLSVQHSVCLDYQDGQCAVADEQEALEKLKKIRPLPDAILTFGVDGLTGHPDHQAVGRWARSLGATVYWAATVSEQYEQMRPADAAANIFFIDGYPKLAKPDDLAIDFRLPSDLTQLKRKAFMVVESQFEELMAAGPFERPGEGLARECFIRGG
jgi:LmbE family N-acetylglucosaminyl deacetylase